MKFTVNTKSLKNATDLGIIKANISKYYYKSNVVQITATLDTLTINVEASGIKTKMVLAGSGDEDTVSAIIVECSVFKSLIDSIDTQIMTLEITAGTMYIHAGTSKFSIPQMLDISDVQLDEPAEDYVVSNTSTIKPADWQFIKDHQMYAIATKESHPVYKNVWVGKDRDVIVGDYVSSLFTYSKRGDFDTTCLFPASLINLFTSIPEGSTVSKIGKSYILNITTDNYSIITEFMPKYEDDEAVGSYKADMILDMLKHPTSFISVDIAPITKFINQTSLLIHSEQDEVFDFIVKDNTLTISNTVSSYTMPATTDETYQVKFHVDFLKRVLSNFDNDTISIAPMRRGDAVIGGIFWTDNLTTLLAGQG